MWHELKWYFRIGWIKVAEYVEELTVEQTWVHKKTDEKRIVRKFWP